ncbi:hypothetical protein MCUN1_001319 [Malassezia cuniculi]|uniref:Sulfhydryl oxidase n=1 Tax=Malassezia cuniculi TaxID=948313 RepID=A0AAF0EXL1_9BASI|nr:hypothetical protein MCUN1_001319 [Malassezia cuniculi]
MRGAKIASGVQAALREGRPVVALESTIITHGLPRPINYETALEAEAAVRRGGAEPATIAVIDGVAHVGLDKSQLARVAESTRALKASRASLAHALALGKGWVAGLTVSGTMALAHRAGIRVFATGGIGGVHRGAESSMDISADLVELGRTRVGVFCSGAKSILDIPRTLEYLETQGVPVLSFNPSGEFPAFYSSCSGLYVPSISSPAEAAAVLAHNERLGLENGVLFGVPIPKQFEPQGAKIQAAVETAVRESIALGIDKRGKEATPWLLRRVSQLAAESVQSNIGLMLNNAHTAAQCAVELCKMIPKTSALAQGAALPVTPPRIVVLGAAAVDVCAHGKPTARSTVPGHIQLSVGGVAHNVARAAHAMSKPFAVQLIAPLAADVFGQYVKQDMSTFGMRTDGLVEHEGRTPACNLLLDDGDLVAGVADMDMTAAITPEFVRETIGKTQPSVVAIDANLSPEAVRVVLEERACRNFSVVYEPTSVAKCGRIIEAHQQSALSLPRVDVATPNAFELRQMASLIKRAPVDTQLALDTLHIPFSEKQRLVSDAIAVMEFTDTLFVKLGAHGVLVVWRSPDGLRISHSPAPKVDPAAVINTTGAGDTFTGAVLALLESRDPVYIATLAQQAAVLSLQTLLLLVPTFVYLSHRGSINVYESVRYSDDSFVNGAQFAQLSQGSGPPPAAEQLENGNNNFLHGMKSLWEHVKSDAWPLPKPAPAAESTQQKPNQVISDLAAFTEEAVSGAYAPKMSNDTARQELGRATWKFLHTLTLRFPEKPTEQQSKDFKEFFRLFSLLYPCGDCAAHFQQLLKEMPPQAASRKNAASWLCGAHNKVNARLGKPEFDCNLLDSAYDCGCAPSADADAAALATLRPADATGVAHVMT